MALSSKDFQPGDKIRLTLVVGSSQPGGIDVMSPNGSGSTFLTDADLAHKDFAVERVAPRGKCPKCGEEMVFDTIGVHIAIVHGAK